MQFCVSGLVLLLYFSCMLPSFVKSELLETYSDISHFFTTRHGGVSTGCAASLNMGFTDNDVESHVASNRSLALSKNGMDNYSLVNLKQIHSDKIFIINEKVVVGKGSATYVAGEGDALITNVSQQPIMVLTADCVPLLLFDTGRRVVAAVHAGWRGTVARITAKTVKKMIDVYGTSPGDIVAAIGPSIGVCCYEVGNEVEDKANQNLDNANELFVRDNGRLYFDLWEANVLQLISMGVPKSNIDNLKICSKCNHKEFFSSRADNGNTGRMGSVIMLK